MGPSSCLVCGSATRIAHLGIDCCRACAVFYRRAGSENRYTCRAGTRKCSPGRDLNCKRCRFDTITTLLARSEALNVDQSVEEGTSSEMELEMRSEKRLLDRVRTNYKTMCFNRLSGELNSRINPPHPLDVDVETGPFFMADFASLINAVRILLTSALEFGRATFPEFAGLERADKWNLALNFFYHFRMFEGCYRTHRIFTHESNKFFVTYVTYMTFPLDKNFFDSAPEGANTTAAFEFLQNGDLPRIRQNALDYVAKVDLKEEELLVAAVLMFWKTGYLSVSDEVRQIGEKYRREVLKELHTFYRHEMGLDDYATRLGELMMLMQIFETREDVKIHSEVLRLLNVMTDDNFIYQIGKEF